MQMALAAELSRPVSVHCVKAYGKIVDFLRDADRERPPRRSSGSRARSGNGGAENSGGEADAGGGGGGGAGDDVSGCRGCRIEAGGGDGSGDERRGREAGPSPGVGRDLKRDSGATERIGTRRLLPQRIALQ